MFPLSITHPAVERLTGEIARAQQLLNEEQNQEARRVCEQVLGAAAALGLGAPDAAWLAAVAASNTKDLEAAVRYARRALEADPTSPSYRRSFDVIGNNVRQALLDDKLAPDDATIPALHGLAVDAEAVDQACHLRLAHYLLSVRRLDEARAVLLSVTVLHPSSVDAWVLLTQVASIGDDGQLAEQCKSRVHRLQQLSLAFPQPPAEG